MPFGDKKGPEGRGPLTGRQAGYCAGNDRPGSYEPGAGRGLGRGRGFVSGLRSGFGGGFGGGFGRGRRNVRQFSGRGFGAGRFDSVSQQDFQEANEETALKSQADWLKQQLEYVSGRLADIISAKKKQD